jgi:hypothetical protein
MTDTGRPDRNGLMGDCDCMTLWTIRAAQAAGLEHETLCAIMAEAQGMAEAGTHPQTIVDTMRPRWPGILFTVVDGGHGRNPGWVILGWNYPYRVPVAFSPTGWER